MRTGASIGGGDGEADLKIATIREVVQETGRRIFAGGGCAVHVPAVAQWRCPGGLGAERNGVAALHHGRPSEISFARVLCAKTAASK